MKKCAYRVVRGALVCLSAALPLFACGSSRSGGTTGSAFDCGVCDPLSVFSCVVGSNNASATLPTITADGCSGTFETMENETIPLFIHCDSARICVEHENECFAGTSTGTSFSYQVKENGITVSCTAN